MTDKEFKRLNRRELLELLLAETKKTAKLQRKLDEASEKLQDRTIKIESSGSLADASLLICNVLDSAQQAAEVYEENCRNMADEEVSQAREEAKRIIDDAWKKYDEIQAMAADYVKNIENGLREMSVDVPELTTLIDKINAEAEKNKNEQKEETD